MEPAANQNSTSTEGEQVVYLGDNVPVVIKPNQRIKTNSESKVKTAKTEDTVSLDNKSERDTYSKQQQPKRGQKSKLKKIKEKYKDQDETERKLRMDILQSAGSGKETKKSKKSKDNQGNKNKKGVIQIPKPAFQKKFIEEDAGADEEDPGVQVDIDMIDALTGLPLPDDELLFAVPVVAPYNTLSNYKYVQCYLFKVGRNN